LSRPTHHAAVRSGGEFIEDLFAACMAMESTGRAESDQVTRRQARAKRALRAARQRGAEVAGESGPSAQCAQIFLGVDVEVDAVVGDGHLVDTLGMGFEQAARASVAPEPAQLSLV